VIALGVAHITAVLALATVTFTVVVVVLKSAGLLGVKVTPCADVPALGAVLGVVHVNVPVVLAAPPVSG
jgi:hypothetical protein